MSLTKQGDRSTVTKTEYPDISSPEVDYPPRLVKDQAGATLTKLNPENSQTVIRHMPTGDPATQVHGQHSSTSTGNTRDVGKKQSIKRSKSASDTMSRGDCHQCQHCLRDLSSSNDSGIELQPPSLSSRSNTHPHLSSQQPETNNNAPENPICKKTPSQLSKATNCKCIVFSLAVFIIVYCDHSTKLSAQHETKPPKQQDVTRQGRKSLSWLSSFRKKGSTELNESVTVSWKVKRSEFVVPLFFHKNNCFEKKVEVSAGSGPTRLNLDVNFKLFPNGINWDQDSYSTLKIEVTSQTLSSDVHLQLVVTGADCETGDVITSRHAEWPLHEKAYIIKEFIAHEVIKVSSAKHFEFKATLRVKYSLSKDWVVVDPIIP